MKKNNVFTTILGFLFLINCALVAIIGFGLHIDIMRSLALSIAIVNSLIFVLAMVISGGSEANEDSEEDV